jgi:putative DNA primase/helicase
MNKFDRAAQSQKLIDSMPMPNGYEAFDPDSLGINTELVDAYAAQPATVANWPELQPIAAKTEAFDYPVDALPSLIRDAVLEVQGFVQAPAALVGLSAMAAVSLAAQAHYDIERAPSLTGPVGLFLVAIAESGERKSSCDGYFSKALRDHDADQLEAAKPDQQKYAADIAAWTAEKQGIESAIKHAAKNGEDTAELRQKLHKHESSKPMPPVVPRLVYADATPEALIDGLAAWKSGGVLSAEAGVVLGGHAMGDAAMRNLATMNVLWDGGAIRQDRRTRPTFSLEGARLTVALQVQEPTLREFIKGTGELARGTGFFARCLMAWPQSTQGKRGFKSPPTTFTALADFTDRLKLILSREVPFDHAKTMLHLSDEAKAIWVRYHDRIEMNLREGGALRDVRDIASKTADNAARLAGLFHVFEGHVGAVGARTMSDACTLAAWHLNESQRFFGEMALPRNMSDAARVEDWLIQCLAGTEVTAMATRDIQRLGPVRDRMRLDAAIDELVDLGRVRRKQAGKQRLIQVRSEVLGGAQ